MRAAAPLAVSFMDVRRVIGLGIRPLSFGGVRILRGRIISRTALIMAIGNNIVTLP